ncbi:MAG: peptide-methionine (S)-S-oxide reductase MsrA [Giesbergeria sp.]|nr:peptide-methionine (S)-S-oxide reductase MsrA [Giesbergeria sp.]
MPLSTITLGGGCFWCTEAVFERVRGISHVQSGYCNGAVPQPSYEQVCTGRTGHNEVVRLTFDPAVISTQQILEIFFAIHDPTTLNRQGNDVGTQYRSGIYFHTSEQQQVAQAMLEQLAQDRVFDAPLTTELAPEQNFWPAENYHHQYYARNPGQGYCAAVVGPKVAKFRQTFTQFLKP